jgi:hypothetical protein
MKQLYTLCVLLLLTTTLWAQSPEKMSYQAVVRGSNNQLISLQKVGVRVSILQGSPTGTSVYSEIHTPNTNVNGLATFEIGGGTIVSGTFSTINWGTGTYFIRTEIDPSGGTSYSITSVNQMLSVPYALYAKTSGSGAGATGATGATGPIGLTGATGLTGQQVRLAQLVLQEQRVLLEQLVLLE